MKWMISFLFVLFLVALPLSAAAQEEVDVLIVSLRKDFGYAAGGKIQGSFSLKVRSPDDLMRVYFLIDGQVVHTATEDPFEHKFNTADFSVGEHTFSAIGYRADGTQLSSSELRRELITAEQAWENVGRLVVPLFVGVGGISLLGILGSVLMGRKKDFKLGEYGAAGGVVCPRCQMPYSASFLAPNLVVGKLLCCPHCGKWAVTPRASQAALEAAEARYATDGVGDVAAAGEGAQFREMVEESRYEQ